MLKNLHPFSGQTSSTRSPLASKLLLWAQRRRWPIPHRLRRVARRLLARSVEGTPSVEEWTTPLIAGRPSPLPQSVAGTETAPTFSGPIEARAASRPAIHQNRRRADVRLTCAVATGVLDIGGLDRMAALLGRLLPEFGIDVTIVYPTSSDDFVGAGEHLAESLRRDGVAVIKLSAENARSWFAANRPSVVSAHGAPKWMIDAASDAGIPIIETLHGSHSLFHHEAWPAERLRSRNIAGFVAVSDLVARQYQRANPDYPADRIAVIPNGVDEQYIVRSDRSRARAWLGLQDEFLFVSMARYHLQKNTFGLVAAFADVARSYPNAHLLVAGQIHDVAYYEQVRRLRDQSGCAAQIHLRGHCSTTSDVLAAADAFVLDSFFEGWPLAPMEALFAGIPVVISEVGGAVEIVGADDKRGYVVPNPLGDPETMDWELMSRLRFAPQGNRQALADAMSRVVAQGEHWRRMRGSLQADSIERFSAERCVALHAEVLRRAAARQPLSASAVVT